MRQKEPSNVEDIKTGTPPRGQNRLARLIGKRLAIARGARSLSYAEAASQLGVSPGAYVYLEQGRILANQPVYDRILRWLVYGQTFEGLPLPRASDYYYGSKEEWPLIKSRIPRSLAKSLGKASQRLHMSQAAIIHMALEQFLATDVPVTNLLRAKLKIERARMVEAMNTSPAIREILSTDMKTLHTIPDKNVIPKPPPIEQVANLPLTQIKDAGKVELDERAEWEV